MIKIGNIKIDGKVALAPMAGISNPAYMKIVEKMGCSYAITELISSEAIVRNNKKTLDMLAGYDTLNMPVALQLFGSNPDSLAKAAKVIEEYGFKVIDLNFGCPVPKVAVRSEAGSALLKYPEKIREIVSRVVESVSIPVTVKIRSGWDFNSINAVEVAKICEEAGASMITIHARTRSQGYSGKADWNIIKEVKEAVNIPVIGNGDITDIYKAKEMLDTTGCDMVMVGRAALGNPWIFKEISSYLENGEIISKPSYVDKIDMALQHLNNLCELKNTKTAVLEIRNHIGWYLRNVPLGKEIKNKIFKETDINVIIDILNVYKKEILDMEGNNNG